MTSIVFYSIYRFYSLYSLYRFYASYSINSLC